MKRDFSDETILKLIMKNSELEERIEKVIKYVRDKFS